MTCKKYYILIFEPKIGDFEIASMNQRNVPVIYQKKPNIFLKERFFVSKKEKWIAIMRARSTK